MNEQSKVTKTRSLKKIQYIIGSAIILIIIASIFSSLSSSNQPLSANSASVSSEPTVKKTATPKYEILGRQSTGVLETFCIYVDGISETTPNYKESYKAVITDLAKKKNMTEFMAYLYDNKEVAQYYADYSTGKIGLDENQAKTMSSLSETTLIASYSGGLNLETGKVDEKSSNYTIIWFMNAVTSSKVFSQHSTEQFKPEI